MEGDQKDFYEFGPFRLDTGKRLLLRDQSPVPIAPKVFDTLVVLVRNRERVVKKDELIRMVWADSFVEDASLTNSISALRKILAESPTDHRYIVTVPGQGYRFVAPVKGLGRADAWRLRWPFALAAGAVAAAALFGPSLQEARGRLLRTTAPGHIRSLVVLPLENLFGDKEQDYFADGMTDELITDLGKIGSLRVISRTSAMQYKGSKKLLPKIARELNVDAVVEGTVLRSGEKVRITTQLIEASTDKHLWSEAYEPGGLPAGSLVAL